MLLAVVGGEPLNHPDSTLGSFFHLSRTQIAIALVRLRLHRLGAAGVAAAGAARLPQLVHQDRHHLAARRRRHRRQPRAARCRRSPSSPAAAGRSFPGPLFPFCFITIACGAISGFHALISSGTTPKMIDKETDIRPIGYGAMLIEGAGRRHGARSPPRRCRRPTTSPSTSPPAAYAAADVPGRARCSTNLAPIEAAVGENGRRAAPAARSRWPSAWR